MAINVKVMDRPINEVSYVRATLSGLGPDAQAHGGPA
jgi:hypothetical protein